MTVDLEKLSSRLHAIEGTIPLLEAIRSVAEIGFRRAERAAGPLTGYTDRLESFLTDLLSLASAASFGGFSAPEEDAVPAVVVISSERGLCGGFNKALASRTLQLVHDYASAGKVLQVLCWGSRARRLIETSSQPVLYAESLATATLPPYETVESMALELLELQERDHLSPILILHNAVSGRFEYSTTVRQLLPPRIEPRPTAHRHVELKPEGDGAAMSVHILAEWTVVELYNAAVQSILSEQLARIATMRLAVDNAKKLAGRLHVEHELARQRQVTDALLEVVAGYRTATER